MGGPDSRAGRWPGILLLRLDPLGMRRLLSLPALILFGHRVRRSPRMAPARRSVLFPRGRRA